MAPSTLDSFPTSMRPSSSTAPHSSPPTSLSGESFTSSFKTRQRGAVLVTMGPCNWQKPGYQCPCTSGSCTSDLDASRAVCDTCMHPMSMHDDYAAPDPAISSHAPSRMTKPYSIPSSVNPRTKLVDEMIKRVQHYHIIRVRGTPASGKTNVMNLVVNKLFEDYRHTTPIYTLTGWDPEMVSSATGWKAYLKQQTGVDGDKWRTYPAYMLIDEAQQSYWDDELWAVLFKAIEPRVDSPFVILFASYGSPGWGPVDCGEKYITTPMVFGADQEISLRPDENIEDYSPDSLQRWRQVGLLLDENEGIDILTRWASSVMPPSPSLSADLKKNFFRICGGHVGLLTSFARVLRDVPALYELVRNGISIDWQTASKHLFGQPLVLFKYIGNYPFARGLPKVKILQESATARVFKKAIAEDGVVSESSFKRGSEEFKALQSVWRNGWLHAEKSKSGDRYVFATQVHRWYCSCLLLEIPPDGEINYNTPLELAVDAIRQFRPRQLSDPPRKLVNNTSKTPVEDQYQKEFYRCLFTKLDGHVEVSPEFTIKPGINGGTIDFLVARKKWGLELLRDRDRLVNHMERFEPGGQYFSMIQSGEMEKYIVLDFTVPQPAMRRPEYRGLLYHIVFSQNYRQVRVIDASDLSTTHSFTLMENDNPMA